MTLLVLKCASASACSRFAYAPNTTVKYRLYVAKHRCAALQATTQAPSCWPGSRSSGLVVLKRQAASAPQRVAAARTSRGGGGSAERRAQELQGL